MVRQIKETESCFTCIHFELCYLRVGMKKLIASSNNMLNIDGDVRPLPYTYIYVSLGNCCTKFQNQNQKTK
jgi:hypothetical protein